MVALCGKKKRRVSQSIPSSREKQKPPKNVRPPVDLGVLAIVDNLLDNVKVEELGQVLLDEGKPLFGRHLRHGGGLGSFLCVVARVRFFFFFFFFCVVWKEWIGSVRDGNTLIKQQYYQAVTQSIRQRPLRVP